MKLIIDVKNVLYRMGWRYKTRTEPHNNTLIGPTYGFFDFLRGILHRFPHTTELVLCCDPVVQQQVNWRRTILPEYKMKDPNENIDALVKAVKDNLTIVRNLCAGLPCTWYEDPNWEADDLIADIVGKLEPHQRATIVSQDKDLLQLAGYPNVEVAYPSNGNYVIFNHMTFAQAFDTISAKKTDKKPLNSQLTPRALVVVKCLMGDKSDNIDGLTGIALKRAIQIVQTVAQMVGGMHNLPVQPAEVYRMWIQALPGLPKGGPKWAHTALREHPRAFDLLTRNYGLIALMSTGRVVTTADSFTGTFMPGWLDEWFAYYNFHELKQGPERDYLFNSLTKLTNA